MSSGLPYLRSDLLCTFGLGVIVGMCIRSSQIKNLLANLFKSSTRQPILNLESKKLALVVRTDLGMSKGKIAAQCCHAAVSCFRKSGSTAPISCTKVALKIENEQSLLQLAAKVNASGVVHSVIQDAGHTQVAPGSVTVLGIGPAPVSVISELTGHLKLL